MSLRVWEYRVKLGCDRRHRDPDGTFQAAQTRQLKASASTSLLLFTPKQRLLASPALAHSSSSYGLKKCVSSASLQQKRISCRLDADSLTSGPRPDQSIRGLGNSETNHKPVSKAKTGSVDLREMPVVFRPSSWKAKLERQTARPRSAPVSTHTELYERVREIAEAKEQADMENMAREIAKKQEEAVRVRKGLDRQLSAHEQARVRARELRREEGERQAEQHKQWLEEQRAREARERAEAIDQEHFWETQMGAHEACREHEVTERARERDAVDTRTEAALRAAEEEERRREEQRRRWFRSAEEEENEAMREKEISGSQAKEADRQAMLRALAEQERRKMADRARRKAKEKRVCEDLAESSAPPWPHAGARALTVEGCTEERRQAIEREKEEREEQMDRERQREAKLAALETARYQIMQTQESARKTGRLPLSPLPDQPASPHPFGDARPRSAGLICTGHASRGLTGHARERPRTGQGKGAVRADQRGLRETDNGITEDKAGGSEVEEATKTQDHGRRDAMRKLCVLLARANMLRSRRSTSAPPADTQDNQAD